MPESRLTRRAASAALRALAFGAAAPSRGALARVRSRAAPSGVRVDVEALRASVGDPTAAWVADFLPGQIAQQLARRGARASVSVRIDTVTLGSNTGGLGPAGSSYDNIGGVATIDGVERPVRATSSYYPSPVDQTMIEQANRERVRALTQALAYWIAQDAVR